LLDPEFVAELEALRRLLRVRARSGLPGTAPGRTRGGSAEFEEHRAYAPGDDVQRIDWLAYARTGHPVLKEHRADEDTIVRLVVDASASLGFGEPKKIDCARRLAAALAHLALSSSERADLVVVEGSKEVRSGPDVASPAAGATLHRKGPRRGRTSLGALLRELLSTEPVGAVELSDALRRVLANTSRPGLLAVVSDFLDAGPFTDVLSRAAYEGHDLALVQVLSAEELRPELEGDFVLEDAETGETLELSIDAEALEAYRKRLESSFDTLRAVARRWTGTYVRARTDEPLVPVVRRILRRAID
jgi:uncharacterized protein (DUF58 family)